MAQVFYIHEENPQGRLIKQSSEILKKGGVIIYPTDSCYALGCLVNQKEATEKMRQIRRLDEKHLMTIVCKNLSELGTYAKVNNAQYRYLKANTPSCTTFILEATKEVPRRLQQPKRATIGLRIPENAIVQALIEELGEPILTTSLIMPNEKEPLNDPYDIEERLGNQVDLIINAGYGGLHFTKVIDLSQDGEILIIRE